MRVIFRIPNGGGGMVQGMASAELKQTIAAWEEIHGTDHIARHSKQGWFWHVEFDSERSWVLFLTTFQPKHPHWWKNCRIEKG